MFEVTFPEPLVLVGKPHPMGLYLFGTILAQPFWRTPEGAPLAIEIHTRLGTTGAEQPAELEKRMVPLKSIRLSSDAYQALKREVALDKAQLAGEVAFIATAYALAVYQARPVSDAQLAAAAE